MLNTVVATRFIKRMGNGRTRPCLIECEDAEGNLIEVVVKCSAALMQREEHLLTEAVAAMLAADLNLPVPEPFVVDIGGDFADLIPDTEPDIKENFRQSCWYAFGSKFLPNGFAVWPRGEMVPEHLVDDAAAVFVFDVIIVNSDRRPENPNCLWSAKEIAIFDHELTFAQHQILFWKAPWADGGFDQLHDREKHIFARPYFPRCPEGLDKFVAAWDGLPQNRFHEYKNALPAEWVGNGARLNAVVNYLEDARYNIRIIVSKAMEVLK